MDEVLSQTMRIAIIDVGTNTFNLLVVDGQGKEKYANVYTERVGVGLGLGGINENRIAKASWDRALTTLTKFKNKCDELSVQKIYAFGTSAVRNAVNKDEFLENVDKKVGITINVISGTEEATFIYEGVKSGHNFKNPGIIMDIGGGSTEFISANNKGVLKMKSFEIGAARIFQQFIFSDPMKPQECLAIEKYLEQKTATFFDDLEVEELIGASGSFETFYEIATDKPYPKNKFVTLNRVEMEKSLAQIISSTKAEREANPRIIPIRKKMAPIAAVKIRWIIRKLNIQTIIISPFALKEGVIPTVFNQLSHD